MARRGNYGDEKNVDKPNAGEAKPGAERPHGAPRTSDGRQPTDVKGESRHNPELVPGHDPNDKAGRAGR